MRHRTSNISRRYGSFNPRICKRCDVLATREITQRMSFNPRICKRCDVPNINIGNWIKVSIHASVKDATTVVTV